MHSFSTTMATTRSPIVPRPRAEPPRTERPRTEPAGEATAEELLLALRGLERDDPLAVRLRERITSHYHSLLDRIARRYQGRGEDIEDLRQTARIGLMKAIHGYSPERGKAFISYLLPTVTGEIKRHFRDHTWAVHTPRDPQSLRPRLRQARRELEQRLFRAPTNAEIAREMEITVKEVEEVLLVSEAYNTLSLDSPEPHRENSAAAWERYLGVEDHNLNLVVERESARAVLKTLPARERLILKRRFFDEWKQERIAQEVGCSQMHVSRLITACLERLRGELADQD